MKLEKKECILRSYLRFDPEFADRKAHYPDGAMATFAMTLCFAEQQPQRGVFKRAVLRALLEKRARWIPYLLEHGDLEQMADGKLYMVGWNEWQEGDWKVHERVQRIRARRVTPGTVTDVTLSTVITPSEQQAVGGRQQATSGRQPGDGVKTLRRFKMPHLGFRGGEPTKLAESLPKAGVS